MFQYVLGLPKEFTAATLVFGSAIHARVQHHFEQLMVGNPPPGLDILLDVFHEAWKQEATVIRFSGGDDFNSLCRLADRLLRAFQASDFAKPEGTILRVEEELRGRFVDGCPELLARVDLIVETADTLVIADFKTSRTNWSTWQAASAAPQLLIYSDLARPLANGKSLRLNFAVLTKTKLPQLSVHSVADDPVQADRLRTVVERVWQAIQAQHFYPNASMLNCPTCPFQRQCRAWKG